MDEKTLTDAIQTAVKTLRDTNENFEAEKKEWGHKIATSDETLAKINNSIDELQLKFERMNVVKPDPAKMQSPAAKSFFKWMREGKAGLNPEEKKALVEDATGLYLIPEDIASEIVRALPAISRFRNFATIRNTTRDKLRWRSMAEVSMGWGKLETGTSISGLESSLVPATDYIYAEDLVGLTKIGEDELMDSDENLAAFIAESFARSRASVEDAAFATGRGHSTYLEPAGVAVNATLVNTNKIDLDTADTITTDDMVELEYSLPAQYLPNASFMMHRKTEMALRLFRPAVASGYYGNYMWQPPSAAGQPSTFDGFPIFNSSSMNYPADTTDEKTAVVFGDFKAGYWIVDRSGMTIQRLDELYAESGLVGFKAHFRVGGGVVNTSAFYCLNNESS
jgi:HK97 family phage major capsid protein